MDLVFDPVGSAKSIPSMIKNDTLLDVLDRKRLSECLKHIALDVDDSIYIFEKAREKYHFSKRLRAINRICTDFGERNPFDSKNFVKFIRSLGECLHIHILDTVADIVESAFSKLEQYTRANGNIETLKAIPNTEENFDKIYRVFERIALENDTETIDFAVREKYCYVTEIDKNGKSIITKAVSENQKYLTRLLINSNIDVNAMDRFNNTALFLASRNGIYEIVKLLLSFPEINVNSANKSNSTPLMIAAAKSHYGVVELLLNVDGIDVNAMNNYIETALMYALQNNDQDIVQLLLNTPGIDVNAKNNDNNSALNIVKENGNYTIMRMLKNRVILTSQKSPK